MNAPFSVVQVKREADALIDHGVPGPLFCRYTAPAPYVAIPPAERQRRNLDGFDPGEPGCVAERFPVI